MIQKILVIRFRQLGDAVIATALLNTLRRSFPHAEIHFVLNDNIRSLFEGHPSIDRLITFSEAERHSALRYARKVWRVVHDEHYDAIIDMRSTVNTMLFALFSPSTPYRIGLRKGYTWAAFSHRVQVDYSLSMVERNVGLAAPLAAEGPVQPVLDFSLHVSEQERADFHQYLIDSGVDFARPLVMLNVTAKIASKVWEEEKMAQVVAGFIERHPEAQLLFNYAPGAEEENARRIYARLGSPRQVMIDVTARSARQMVALFADVDMFFGNEGGARHIAQACGVPSLVVCCPNSDKHIWLFRNSVAAEGIAPADFATPEQLATLSYEQRYSLISPEFVTERLEAFYQKNVQKGASTH